MRALSSVAFALCALVACSGRTIHVGSDAGSGAPDGASNDACMASGVRLCGASCPPLDSTECPPDGCSTLTTLSGASSSAGICWSDDPEANVGCATCADGDACLQRTATSLVCVPAEVCASLWAAGARDVCRYADKETYDGRALPTPTGCPAGASEFLCGGDCPACPSYTSHRCIGRSPDHPFGFCAPESNDPNDGTSIATCALSGGTVSSPCPQAPVGVEADDCAVFRTGAGDQDLSRLYGVCVLDSICKKIAGSLPGGLDCYDSSGHLQTK